MIGGLSFSLNDSGTFHSPWKDCPKSKVSRALASRPVLLPLPATDATKSGLLPFVQKLAYLPFDRNLKNSGAVVGLPHESRLIDLPRRQAALQGPSARRAKRSGAAAKCWGEVEARLQRSAGSAITSCLTEPDRWTWIRESRFSALTLEVSRS